MRPVCGVAMKPSSAGEERFQMKVIGASDAGRCGTNGRGAHDTVRGG
jgi:hypothetical protein